MFNGTQADRSKALGSSSSGRISSYVGANTDRQRRFEARSARRWGDWFILNVPTPLLWLDDGDDEYLLAAPSRYEVWPPAVIELWP